MAWTTPATVTTGDLVTASWLNTYLRDNTKALKAGEMVTALPTSGLVDGDRVTFVDSLTAPTYAWYLRYIAGASTYKWYCIGGTPALIETTTAEAGSMGSTYGDLATVGPSFTLPLAGDWDIEIGCTHINDYNGGAARDSYMSYAIGGTSASDNDAIKCTGTAGVLSFVGTRTRRKTGLASSTALVAKYRYSGGTPTMTWGPRTLRVMPFRVN